MILGIQPLGGQGDGGSGCRQTPAAHGEPDPGGAPTAAQCPSVQHHGGWWGQQQAPDGEGSDLKPCLPPALAQPLPSPKPSRPARLLSSQPDSAGGVRQVEPSSQLAEGNGGAVAVVRGAGGLREAWLPLLPPPLTGSLTAVTPGRRRAPPPGRRQRDKRVCSFVTLILHCDLISVGESFTRIDPVRALAGEPQLLLPRAPSF